MQERRKTDRIDAHDVGLGVFNAIDGEQLGIISNLSDGGLMLITGRELFAGGILQLRIDLPVAVGPDAMLLGAKVLWCAPAHSPNEHWAGLEIIDVSDTDRDRLGKLLDYLSGANLP